MDMRSSVWLLARYCAVISLTIACRDSSGPSISPSTVALVSGDAQPTPQVGTKLPLPLTIKVTDAQGRSLAGINVAWVAKSGTLSASSSITDAGGTTSVEWTLGTAAGSQTATATVTGLKPVTFTAIAVAGQPTQIILSRDTVQLLGVGDSFRLNARAADQYGNTVIQATTVESADTTIVTADNFGSGAILTAHASDKTTSVSATAGSLLKTGTVVVLPPPCGPSSQSFNLAVGQIAVFSGIGASEFCVQGTPSGAEFIAIPYYSDFNGSLLRISIFTENTTIGVTGTRVITPSFQLATPATVGPIRDETFELKLRQRSIDELTPLIPAARMAEQQSEGRFNLSVAVPAVGDILKLNTNSSSACSNAFVRTGRVVAITNHAIIVADTANPANGFTTADFLDFGAAFDTLVFPVDSINFGAPSDVDKNQRAILFFTRAVNELTPPGQNFYVGGFFFSRDLFPTTATGGVSGCATSNYAEMFYLLVPDPDGVVNQNVRTVDFVKSVTVGTLAHEFQHLINASRHLYVNRSSVFEDTFLDEGLAHEAEELAFFRSSGLTPGQNISYQLIQSSPNLQRAFDNFAAPNFRRFREYLINPLGNSPYINNSFIQTRGAIWSFLRYAADRRNAGESQMWFQLANPPSGVHGVGNLTRAVTQDLSAWVRDWSIANYADDFVPGVSAVDTHPSWNIRSIIEVVNQGMWALDTQQLDSANITTVGITDGSAAYLRFGVRPGTSGGGRITARGAVVPSGFSLSVLRTK
ncbi:MAG TPA: Ig-like domain-containing protein [Gemmatimonadaceae bacterium]|nr:Ig-like domain-containing protein [Gemmatimonadaceae bacterium]